MTLINCSECGREFSDKAAACPNCGNPIPSEGKNYTPKYEYQPVTIEQTSKGIKLFAIIGTLMLIVWVIIILWPTKNYWSKTRWFLFYFFLIGGIIGNGIYSLMK